MYSVIYELILVFSHLLWNFVYGLNFQEPINLKSLFNCLKTIAECLHYYLVKLPNGSEAIEMLANINNNFILGVAFCYHSISNSIYKPSGFILK